MITLGLLVVMCAISNGAESEPEREEQPEQESSKTAVASADKLDTAEGRYYGGENIFENLSFQFRYES